MRFFRRKPPAPSRKEFDALVAERDRLAAENEELQKDNQRLATLCLTANRQGFDEAKGACEAEVEALRTSLAEHHFLLKRVLEKNQRLVEHLRKKFAPRPGRNQKREERKLEAMLDELDASREPKGQD